MFTPLQQRELFHLSFLRLFTRRILPHSYALKGGTNLRFFYQSPRYSEDMDLDIAGIPVFKLKKIVMEILSSKTLQTILRPFQIDKIVPPNIQKAKQTETVQRFKVHLLTASDEDLFTKIEFSRRKLEKGFQQEPIEDSILFGYRQPPLIVSHYPAGIALAQKIQALLDRAIPQARDVFDIFMLLTQLEQNKLNTIKNPIPKDQLKRAKERLLTLDYRLFSDTVCAYLSEEDRVYYDQPKIWETILLKVRELLI